MSRRPSGLTRLCGSKGAVLLWESVGLESLWPVRAAWVRIPLPAPEMQGADLKREGSLEKSLTPGGLEKNVCFYFGECSFTSVLDVYRTSCLMNAFGSDPGRLPVRACSGVLWSQAAESVWLFR